MKNLPALSSRIVLKVLQKCGFEKDRQKGSHLILIHPTTHKRVVLPIHKGKTIKKPLLQSIIKNDMEMTVEDFLRLL